MEVHGYIKRKITEEQRLKLQEVKAYINKTLNNKKDAVEKVAVKKSFLFIPYTDTNIKLKHEIKETGYFFLWTDIYGTTWNLSLKYKGVNRITLANLFSGEEPHEAYLSPDLSQALTNFIEEVTL